MKIWTCTSCGANERLNTFPDGCSVCGGQLETQDDRHIAGFREGATFYRNGAQVEAWAAMAIGDFEAEMKSGGDVASAIRLWHDGEELTAAQQATVDAALAANRVDLITRVFGEAA